MSKKVFLITGASSGIGASAATHLASLGHTVYGAARRIERLKELESKGVHAVQLDVTNTESIQPVVDKIIEKEGHIDVLVNNAGFGTFKSIEESSLEEAKAVYDVNLFGLAEMTKAVLPSMRARKQGRIINISSVGGVVTFPLFGWYQSTKFALEGWSDVLRMELLAFNIPVIVIQPGAIATEFGNELIEEANQNAKLGPYDDLKAGMLKMFDNPKTTAKMSDPIVIAKAIEHAGLSNKPKTRYTVGFMAKPMVFIRKRLNDLKWSKAMLKQLGIKARTHYDL